MQIIVVKSGDTVFSISQQYGIPVSKIVTDNGVVDNRLAVGQSLVLLKPEVIHTVRAGDTLYSIARQYDTTVNTIYRNNYGLSANPFLFDGQVLTIKNEGEQVGVYEAGGYAYPYIREELLRTVLPYVTYLMPFTYGFTPSGSLVMLDDGRLLNAAFELGVLPYMHLSTLTSEGNFSNDLSHEIFNNEQAQNTLLANVLKNIQNKGYAGLDIDFEFVFKEDRDAYTRFVRKARVLLNDNGYMVIVALPPKISDDQPGLLYQGVDYAAMGEAANFVLLMTYEWGYSYGPPMAVSPLPSVRRVVDYALTRIPKEKIFLGNSNYGYNWTLPYERGKSFAPSISTVEAYEIAIRYGAEIQYDEVSQAPFFYYTDDEGKQHVVWFEDARSQRARINLILEYGLKGTLYWDFMRENPQNYNTLNGMINVVRK